MSKDLRWFERGVDDRRLDSDDTRSSINDEIDVMSQIGSHVLGVRRTDTAKAIGAWGGDRTAECFNDPPKEIVRRYTDDD